MTLRVIGAGFGRTGTLSLKLALETLGLGRCYHMVEVFANPGHAQKWEAAFDGTLGSWDEIFAGYAATVDWPSCAFYRPLMERYPQAKIVLSRREPHAWFDSTQKTIFSGMEEMVKDDANPFARMVKKIVYGTFAGRIHDRDHAIAVYERHNADVIRTVPPERLLVCEPGEGWGPLCRFLDLPEPATPYPKVNAAEDFGKLREVIAERMAENARL